MENENEVKEFRILVGSLEYDQHGKRIIKGLEFGNSEEQIAISTVSGLETPPIRNNTGDWSGRDGGFMSSQLYSARTITITGFYWDKYYACGPDTEQRLDFPESTREKLANYLKIREMYPIFIKFMSGRVLYTKGYMIDFKMDYEFVRHGQYQITFYCPEYELNLAGQYGDEDSIWYTAELHKEIFGGHLVPEDIPVLFTEGRHPTVVDYPGLIPCYPTITLKGPSTNPTFLNTASNKYFRLGTPDVEDFVMVEGQTLVIDMKNRQCLLNGKSCSMAIDANSEWWYLIPGQNKIYMLSHDGGDNPTAQLTYTVDYQGA